MTIIALSLVCHVLLNFFFPLPRMEHCKSHVGRSREHIIPTRSIELAGQAHRRPKSVESILKKGSQYSDDPASRTKSAERQLRKRPKQHLPHCRLNKSFDQINNKHKEYYN